MVSVNFKMLSIYLAISLAGCLADEDKQNRNADNNRFINDIENTNIIIEHIGESDKPIITIVFSSKCDKADIDFPYYCAELSNNEKHSLIEMLIKKLESKESDKYTEYGSFQFKMINGENQRSFKTNRDESINLFNEIIQILKDNNTAKKLIENNLIRIKF